MSDLLPAKPGSLVAAVAREISAEVKPCPACSLFSILRLRFPRIAQGRHSGKWLIADGCRHAAVLQGPEPFGLWATRAEAVAAWDAEVQRLLAEMTTKTPRHEGEWEGTPS